MTRWLYDSSLILNVFLICSGRRRLHYLGLLLVTFTWNKMHQVLFVCYGSITLGTRFSASLAFFQMSRKGLNWNVEITIFAILWFFCAFTLMSFKLSWGEGTLTIRTIILFMKLLIVFFLEVDVIHFMTSGTFFYVAAAVSKMSRHFTFRVFFEAIIAALHCLFIHFLGIYVQK